MAMNSIKLAIILLYPPDGGLKSLLQRPIAGVELFRRLILTLNRSGLDEIIVVSDGLLPDKIERTESSIRNDTRFKGKLTWYDQEKYFKEKGGDKIRSLTGTHGFLLTKGNIVTTARQIKGFINNTLNLKILDRDMIANLPCSQNSGEGIFLLPNNRLDITDQYIKKQIIEGSFETVQTTERNNFCVSVQDIATAKSAEKWLLKQQKMNYTQLMDVWFNCLFSIKISSWLVKTPFTPNQLTLFGLIFGVLAGWLFACGDYINGFLGGLVLAFTAIWDCCDGDVARLKFMESDFGEYLDTLCDNIINIFIFVGITIGVAKQNGLFSALSPFGLLAIGGGLIFILIYFPKGPGKGDFFKGTRMYDVILLLASRNFIYVILLFAVFGRLDWFLWIAGFGSIIFAIVLFLTKMTISKYSSKIS